MNQAEDPPNRGMQTRGLPIKKSEYGTIHRKCPDVPNTVMNHHVTQHAQPFFITTIILTSNKQLELLNFLALLNLILI
jgi:hypothetical protein